MLKFELLKHKRGHLLSDTSKGTYVLVLFLERDKEIALGRRKRSSSILFGSGYYAYVGSARGPGGLRSRIKRHLKKEKKSIWHIDYLRKEAVPVEVWVEVHQRKHEKSWADALIIMKGSQPVENFGNTDDRKSRTHLYYFSYKPSFHAFRRLVMKMGVTD